MLTYDKCTYLGQPQNKIEELRIKAINRLALAGVQIHGVDSLDNIPSNLYEVFSRIMRREVDHFWKICGKRPITSEIGAEMMKRLKVSPEYPQYVEAREALVRGRHDDSLRYKKVMELSNGEPSIIYFGLAHFAAYLSFKHHALNDGIKHGRVDIYANEEQAFDLFLPEMTTEGQYNTYYPDYLHYTEKRSVTHVENNPDLWPGYVMADHP